MGKGDSQARGAAEPPKDAHHPTEDEYRSAIAWLITSLEADAQQHPRPGRTETLRRLNRTEYRNTIRDLLALEVDVETLLPPDEQASHGFDNRAVTANLHGLAQSLSGRGEKKISSLALGRTGSHVKEETFRVRPDVTQDTHIAGLPIGTRGGLLIPYNFPRDRAYEIQVHLMRDRNEGVEGLHDAHQARNHG